MAPSKTSAMAKGDVSCATCASACEHAADTACATSRAACARASASSRTRETSALASADAASRAAAVDSASTASTALSIAAEDVYTAMAAASAIATTGWGAVAGGGVSAAAVSVTAIVLSGVPNFARRSETPRLAGTFGGDCGGVGGSGFGTGIVDWSVADAIMVDETLSPLTLLIAIARVGVETASTAASKQEEARRSLCGGGCSLLAVHVTGETGHHAPVRCVAG